MSGSPEPGEGAVSVEQRPAGPSAGSGQAWREKTSARKTLSGLNPRGRGQLPAPAPNPALPDREWRRAMRGSWDAGLLAQLLDHFPQRLN